MKKFLLLVSVVLWFHAHSQRLDSMKIYSTGMNKYVNTIVILPIMYMQTRQPLPVVYLLHGYSGNQKDWLSKVPAVKYLANSAGCIIVCPDAANSWYINSPSVPESRYADFMAKELVQAIDSIYRTIPSSKYRAITGLSMGGHGALSLAIKSPGVFGAAGSMSGGLDLRPFMNKFDLNKVIADSTAADFSWSDYSVLQMADSTNTRGLKLKIDCGVDDFFLQANRELHQKLLNQRIPHDYIERPGGHSWRYWANAVEYQFLFFKKFFYEKN